MSLCCVNPVPGNILCIFLKLQINIQCCIWKHFHISCLFLESHLGKRVSISWNISVFSDWLLTLNCCVSRGWSGRRVGLCVFNYFDRNRIFRALREVWDPMSCFPTQRSMNHYWRFFVDRILTFHVESYLLNTDLM